MVRLKDIAARAGVSIMTVSKVLRDASDISAATKARIRSLVEEMGYTPDVMAQSLRTRTTKLLGLVIPAITNPIFARTTLAIEEQARALGYDLILAHTHHSAAREELLIRRLMARRVDGLLISPVYRLAPAALVYNEIRKNGTPTVILGQRASFCLDFLNVECDDSAASYQATRHLIELGHRRIAFFAGPAPAPWAQERLDGHRKALRDANLEVDDQLLFAAGSTLEDGEKAALQMLDEAPHATAIQAANDLIAIGAAKVLLAQGLRIPKDLSLVGFGNILMAEWFKIPLTTIRQPKFRLGTAAMEIMTRLLAKESATPQRLPAELVVRSSTAPPPAL